jgi:hypothetical protein
MNNITNYSLVELEAIFSEGGMSNKKIFAVLNKAVPQTHLIYNVDYEKAIKKFELQFSDKILYKFIRNEMYSGDKKYTIDDCIFVMHDYSVVGFEATLCDIKTTKIDNSYVAEITSLALTCRCKERKKELEINLITQGKRGLELTTMEIKKSKLNLDLIYNDDFIEIDKTICKRLNSKKDKGIVLLHGLPGTGKTTYLRNLVGRVKKRILFLPPGIASHITDPDFVNILIDNPDSIVIIEDAENIIMDRNITGNSSVSNLLNISDGLLSDFLNVQLVCTFNTHLSKVDSALLRKGRLIAKYEFGKLTISKAQKLSDSLKQNRTIANEMTLTEIYNQNEKPYVEDYGKTSIGFKRFNAELVN